MGGGNAVPFIKKLLSLCRRCERVPRHPRGDASDFLQNFLLLRGALRLLVPLSQLPKLTPARATGVNFGAANDASHGGAL